MKLKSGFSDYNPVISEQKDIMYTFDKRRELRTK
jgi:hypothetical protein